MFKYIANNKGSTLVFLMIIMTVLILLGVTILTISVTNFKFKMTNSKVKKNFYMTEAGLDEVYIITKNLIIEAIGEGNKSVEDFIKNLDLGEGSIYIKEDGTIDLETLNQAQNELFKDAYKTYVLNNIKNRLENSNNYTLESDGTKPQIRILNDIFSFSEDKLELDIESTFIKDEIEKKIKISLIINTPNYNEPIYITSTVNEIPINTVWEKVISSDGNMLIDSGNVKINGDIFVKGINKSGGITLEGSDVTLNVNGNIITDYNFKINSSNNNIELNGNIFAKNFIISEDTNNTVVSQDEGSFYLMDDLELNGNNCIVDIKGNFYGISDSSDASDSDQSSSIVINTNDIGNGSRLNINGNVIIHGSSFINTYGGKYQTGESISIKGNYIAYTYPLQELGDRGEDKESLKSNNVVFEYYDPLVLVDRFVNGEKLLVQDKSDYIKFYNDEYQQSSSLNLGEGITLDESKSLIHTGALVYDGKIIPSNIKVEDQGVINEKRATFDLYVNKMGDESIQLEKITVNDQIDYTKIINKIEYNSEKKELIILDKDNEDFAIIGPNGDESVLPESITKVLIDNGSVKGIIITNGDLYLLGEIDFIGSIITTDNIYIYNNGIKKFNHNTNIVSKLIYENNITNIFKNNSNNKIALESDININKTEKGNGIQVADLIEVSNWKLIR
ncbi:pilus assembly PilX N-terminal domain-containing protein [Caloranaerobacter ferrireducens]|uniref:pilus assembly PilX N-terminal domain-containing protein n=1 Tax=Caloranaerobacter ferrireducens TaxID=1323370 RepID=UPI00084D3916|nr:pilus assembly PilX N-terminal domain-containing protein [Caloranaerobacter ferrireducens]